MSANTSDITNDIKWIGVFDSDLKVFDIIMETKYGTTYNSYLINTPEGAILVETVKEAFFESYIQHIQSYVGDLSNIKYLITNHTEPDHAGSMALVLKMLPNCTVIGSNTAITYLKDIMNMDFKYITAESLKELKFGGKTFQFISVPFLHWPDSMWTYVKEDEVLFTCDSFGAHYCPKQSIKLSELPESEEADYQDGFHYYYNAIFGPFKPYILKGLEKIKGLPIKVICNGHGPVLDCRINEILDKYKTLSSVEKEHSSKTIVMPYVSAYGYTEVLSNAIEKGIHEADPSIKVIKQNLNLFNYQELKPSLMKSIQEADGVLFGTCTINGDALPPIWDLALSMNPITNAGMFASAFGSYGWSGEGVDNILDRLKQLRLNVMNGFKIKFRPSEKEIQDAVEYGKTFGKAVIDGKIPDSYLSQKEKPKTVTAFNWKELNPSGKVVLWRCVVCGEIFKGVSPPLVCPACGVGQECFELYEPETMQFHSDKSESFVIIGSGAAGISAAEAIRIRNNSASITILSGEKVLPYRRPALSDLLVKDVPDETFYLHTPDWYIEQKINIILNTNVTSIDPNTKSITYQSDNKMDNDAQSAKTMKYDKLIIATGSKAFTPPLKGVDLEGVFSIKWKETTEAIREYSKGKQKAIVIGGGVLGLEAADALLQLGLKVEVLEFAPRIMPRQLDESGSEIFSQILKSKGVLFHTGCSASEILGKDGHVTGVLVGETVYETDLVVINIGVRSQIDLAKNAGLTVNRGIIVNAKCQTSKEDIYAAGDCAEFNKMAIQLWEVAIEMGKVAGINAVGDSAEFSFKEYPVSLIGFGTDIFSLGTIPTSDLDQYHIVSDQNKQKGYYRKLYFKDDILVAAILIGDTLKKCQPMIYGVRNGSSYQEIMSTFFS